MRARSPNERLAVDLHGFGQVGQALLPLLEKSGIRLATVNDRSGVRLRRTVGKVRRVLVDATSPRYDGDEAEAWVGRLEEELERGTPVVTCNKAPLAVAWTRLERATRRGRAVVFCSGTVGGGTPVLLFLQQLNRSYGVERVDATLCATLSYVCSEVAAGATVDEAVQQAKLSGWTEPDPALDLDGTDSFAKAVIIHNLLFTSERPIALGQARPRLRLDEERIHRLSRSGETPQVWARILPGAISQELVGLHVEEGTRANVGDVSVRTVLRGGAGASISGPGAGPGAVAATIVRDLRALAGGSRTCGGEISP